MRVKIANYQRPPTPRRFFSRDQNDRVDFEAPLPVGGDILCKYCGLNFATMSDQQPAAFLGLRFRCPIAQLCHDPA